MSPPELLPEIWVRVIYHVRQPLPPPTGVHPIAAVRQNDLATLMRVSKLFNNLVSTPLYRIVVTDHLPSLIRNLHRPAAATGIKSKTELIGLVRRLYLEYISKEEPSYTSLLSRGGDLYSLVAGDSNGTMKYCGDEADGIARSAAAIKGIPKGLISLSTGAFCGDQGIWETIWASRLQIPNVPDLKQRVVQANYGLVSLVVTHKRMAYYCQRVNYGPLCFAAAGSDGKSTEPGWAGAHGLEFRFHTDQAPGVVPAVTGGTARYYCTFKELDKNDIQMQRGCVGLAEAIGSQIKIRAGQMSQIDPVIMARMQKAGKLASFDIEIYLPPKWRQPQTATFLEIMVNRAIPKSAHKDVITYKDIADSPACEACRWCIADEPEGSGSSGQAEQSAVGCAYSNRC